MLREKFARRRDATPPPATPRLRLWETRLVIHRCCGRGRFAKFLLGFSGLKNGVKVAREILRGDGECQVVMGVNRIWVWGKDRNLWNFLNFVKTWLVWEFWNSWSSNLNGHIVAEINFLVSTYKERFPGDPLQLLWILDIFLDIFWIYLDILYHLKIL